MLRRLAVRHSVHESTLINTGSTLATLACVTARAAMTGKALKLVSLFVTAVTKLLNVTEASNRGPLVLDCGWIKGLGRLSLCITLQLLSLVFPVNCT